MVKPGVTENRPLAEKRSGLQPAQCPFPETSQWTEKMMEANIVEKCPCHVGCRKAEQAHVGSRAPGFLGPFFRRVS